MPIATDVLIIGGGPAGLATALWLRQLHPSWQQRLIVLEKAVHPRPKLCGGGITRPGLQALAELGLSLTIPHVPVREMHIVHGRRRFALRDDPVFVVTHRPAFDHWLLQQARARGLRIHEGEAAEAVAVHEDGIEVRSSKASYRAQVLIIADGSKSRMRQLLHWGQRGRSARLLEVLSPAHAAEERYFDTGIAVFDFSGTQHGLQGYTWRFPALVQGERHMNRGIYDSRVRHDLPKASLPALLQGDLPAHARETRWQGHPIFLFHPEADIARPRLLLVGDAAGADALLGEGIAFALYYGQVAAQEVHQAFTSADFAFSGYRERVLAHPILRQLRGRYQAARFAYGLQRWPWLAGRIWALAPLALRVLAWLRPPYVPLSQPRLHRLPDAAATSPTTGP